MLLGIILHSILLAQMYWHCQDPADLQQPSLHEAWKYFQSTSRVCFKAQQNLTVHQCLVWSCTSKTWRNPAQIVLYRCTGTARIQQTRNSHCTMRPRNTTRVLAERVSEYSRMWQCIMEWPGIVLVLHERLSCSCCHFARGYCDCVKH